MPAAKPHTSKKVKTKRSASSKQKPTFVWDDVRLSLKKGEQLSRRAWKESEAMNVLDERALRLRLR